VGGDAAEAEVRGKATTFDATAVTFTIGPIAEYEGFIPGTSSVNVVLATSAKFEDDRGKDTDRAGFFAALAAASRVSIKGSFANGVFTAFELSLK